jgi:DNA-binding transcriptional ArsR family regulator
MQMADGLPVSGPTSIAVIGPSLALDLSWCLHGANSDSLRQAHPVLAHLYGDDNGLLERVRGFWPVAMGCFAEIQVLAHHARALEVTDFETFRIRTESSLASVPLDLGLASETPEDRAIILDRLAQLRRSARLRQRYFALLSDLWAEVDPWWHGEGAPAVAATAAHVRSTLQRGVKWHQLVRSECPALVQHLPEIIERGERGHAIVLAPCALFGRGLYLELPGCTLIGFGVEDAVRSARARTELVVGPLRALADPTRLAIFDFLKVSPASVSEIAQAFSLAQPTVSIHVKRLREAGLVTATRSGNRREICVNQANTEVLATDLAALLSVPPS